MPFQGYGATTVINRDILKGPTTARKPATRRKPVNFVDDDHQVPSDDNYIASL